jgi:hypothetical protein
MRDANTLLFEWCDETELSNKFRKFTSDFADHPRAMEWIAKLKAEKQTVCPLYTGKLFTCGHVASQRGESNNSRVKRDMKKDLSTCNIFQIVNHVHDIVLGQEVMAQDEIIKLIKNKKAWSKYVDDLWRPNVIKGADFDSVQVDYKPEHGDYDCWVSQPFDCDMNGKFPSHRVKIPRHPDLYPICDCAFFCSNLIPCPGICATLARCKEMSLSVKHLHPRWRLENHPGYHDAARKIGIFIGQETSDDARSSGLLPIDDYVRVPVPKTSKGKYLALKQMGLEVADNGSKASEHTYKMLISQMAKLANCAREDDDDVDAAVVVPLPPKKKPKYHRGASKGNGTLTTSLKRRRDN